VEALGPYTPRFPEPTPVVPNQSWYCVTPVPALHVKVAVEPGSVVPGVGLVIAGAAVALSEDIEKLQNRMSRKAKYRLLDRVMEQRMCKNCWPGQCRLVREVTAWQKILRCERGRTGGWNIFIPQQGYLENFRQSPARNLLSGKSWESQAGYPRLK